MGVHISRSLLDRILAEAAASPDEICGLLLGTAAEIREVRAAANVHPAPARFFEVDPAILLAAIRAARDGGPAVIGHYHSHPSGGAEPSPRDAAAAPGDGALWLIVAGGKARLWRNVADRAFEPVPLARD